MFLLCIIAALLAKSIADDSCTSFVHGKHGKTGRCIKASDCPGNVYLSNLCESKPMNVKCCFNSTVAYKGCPKIKPRIEWKARNAKSRTLLNTPVPFVVIHDTVTPTCRNHETCFRAIRAFQRYHMEEKNWDDIGYNFLISANGSIYEGRGWTLVGSHRKGYNDRSIGIAMIGDYRRKKPDKSAIDALESLIQCGISGRYIRSQYTTLGKRYYLE